MSFSLSLPNEHHKNQWHSHKPQRYDCFIVKNRKKFPSVWATHLPSGGRETQYAKRKLFIKTFLRRMCFTFFFAVPDYCPLNAVAFMHDSIGKSVEEVFDDITLEILARFMALSVALWRRRASITRSA